MVTVTMTGKSEMKAIRIDPSLIKPEESEILEDLIVAASNDARTKAEAVLQERMRELTGGLGLPPGMKLPF
jgi:DNA-binding YbaB/EbfC family protein